MKAALSAHSTKTINNVLAVLGHVFSVAIEWKILATKPRIKRLRNEPPPAPFYEFDQYARLLEAAKRIDARVHLAMLLGGDDEGKRVTVSAIGAWMASVTKRAGLEHTTGLHVLRHAFCSHLAMRGRP